MRGFPGHAAWIPGRLEGVIFFVCGTADLPPVDDDGREGREGSEGSEGREASFD